MAIALRQSQLYLTGFDTGTLNLPSTPIAGNLIVACIASRGGTATDPAGKTTLIQSVSNVFLTDGITMFYMVSDGTNGFRWTQGTSNAQRVWIAEFSGADHLQASNQIANQGPSANPTIPGAAPNNAKQTALLVDFLGWNMDEFSGTPTLSQSAGWTQQTWGAVDGGTAHPWSGVVTQIVTPPAGAVPCSFTNSNSWSRNYGYIAAAFDKTVESAGLFGGEPGGGVW